MILEPTHKIVENTDVATIVDRIVRVNKEMSVVARYDNKRVRDESYD